MNFEAFRNLMLGAMFMALVIMALMCRRMDHQITENAHEAMMYGSWAADDDVEIRHLTVRVAQLEQEIKACRKE